VIEIAASRSSGSTTLIAEKERTMNPISGLLQDVENIMQDVEKIMQEVSQFSNMMDQAGGMGATQGQNGGPGGNNIMSDVMQALPIVLALL
jgi:hypothetical protein